MSTEKNMVIDTKHPTARNNLSSFSTLQLCQDGDGGGGKLILASYLEHRVSAKTSSITRLHATSTTQHQHTPTQQHATLLQQFD
mmetsp:Transcript_40813/g.65552  ORF Transcript_40813/g.65552 Transcript_40813/m.65552 type:complete len:84 (-) Transcript_40813:187-438(-)